MPDEHLPQMTTPVCTHTVVGAAVIMLLALITLPFYPIAVLSFEAGVFAGLFLHSSHTKAAHENGWVEYTDDHKT